jgi:tRNA1(Val) A37 N6-methylase TrmN6
MEIFENERIDEVNDDLKLIQKTKGLTFGTDALLLAGYINGKFNTGIELGGGSGIISMLLLTRGKLSLATCLEVQEEYYELMRRNAELNRLTDRLIPVHTDIRDYRPAGEVDIVFSNPPYMKTDSGRANVIGAKNAARHEVFGGIADFCRAAAKMLKFGASFAVVYRQDRLCDLIYAMRESKLEPKRMTFVHADRGSEPSMVLIEARYGGKCGMKVTRPLIIYEDKEHKAYGADMEYIMENGVFPEDFMR